MDEAIQHPIAHRPVMPQRSDIRFQTELEGLICHIIIVEGVRPTHVREVTYEPYMLQCIIICDKRSVRHHVVGSLMLIRRLWDADRSTSFSDDEVPDIAPHYDSPPAYGSGG